MNQEECAAVRKKREREIHGYKNIAGIIVSNPEKRPGFPISESHRPQIVQKSDLSPRIGTGTKYALEVTDITVGITDNNLKSSRTNTSNFNKSAPNGSSTFAYTSLVGTPTSSKGVQKDKDPITKTTSFATSGGSPGFSKGVQKDKNPMSQTQAGPRMENATRKINVTQSGLLLALNRIREPVLDYQEARGVPRNEDITFLALVTSLVTQAYTAGLTIMVMLWNLMPLVDGFIYFIRFLLDKLIDIVQTENNKDRAIKAAILFGELTVISIISFFIFGLIFMPVYVLVARLLSKIFSMIAW